MNNFQKIEDKKRWKDLLARSLFKTFFHNPQWEEFLEGQFDWLKFEHYLYRDKAILSLARYSVFGKEKVISHPFCEYGGVLPLGADINGREFKKDISEELKGEFKIKFHPWLPKYFQELGLKEPDSASDSYFLEDLNKKTADGIYSNFRKTLRHSIQKAQKENLEIKECTDEQELKDFYRLYVDAIKRHKNIPYPYSFFHYFLNSPDAEIILAKHNDKVIAGSIFLFYDKLVHYFINASDFQHKDKKATYLILWEQVKKYTSTDYEVFDFGGTGRGSSLEIFKKGWGTKKYSIFELKNFRDDKMKKSKLRNVLSVMPVFLSSKLLKFKL